MNLSVMFLKALKEVLLPIVDSAVKNSPTKVDDLIWAAIRARIVEAGMTAPQFIDSTVFSPDDMLQRFKVWIASQLDRMDAYVAAWRTPLELDNIVWGYLRAEIQTIIDQIQFVRRGDGSFAVSAG